jgi:hypothetical protein
MTAAIVKMKMQNEPQYIARYYVVLRHAWRFWPDQYYRTVVA